MQILTLDPKAGRTLKNPATLEELRLRDGIEIGIDVVIGSDFTAGELMMVTTASVTLRSSQQAVSDDIFCDEIINGLTLLKGIALDLASFSDEMEPHELQAYKDAITQLLLQEAEVTIEAGDQLDEEGNPEEVQATITCRGLTLSGKVPWPRVKNYFVSTPEFSEIE